MTEYHHTTQTLSSYVAPTPNAESILSAFNTPFDPRGLTDPVVCSRSDGQAFFITSGEAFGVLDFTRVCNEYERKPLHLKVQGTYEWLCGETRVRLVIERWSFEATEESRWRRGIGDSCAELNSSGFCFDLRVFCLHPRYSREDGRPRRTAIEIQESMTDFEQSTYGHTEGQERRSPLELRHRPSKQLNILFLSQEVLLTSPLFQGKRIPTTRNIQCSSKRDTCGYDDLQREAGDRKGETV
ncbi:hypothetical protein BKA82DRAFT_27437 [Pisolithus tinctorius]|uniref:Uncharacterized protein n=1 Tax=Pisolithus tinctorius Marx 270 TaxID=870435 RepID=A0A0C3NQM0_PISTI|nr:hypothetical protein BKA82DRAFT_27437 [Pisolithus tinctorius]KIO03165.1 hypothetical protein M404DRAFT_27437 [Pisolithus tinctorius Marx 270]